MLKFLQVLVFLAVSTACASGSEATTLEIEALQAQIERLESVIESTTTTEAQTELTFDDFAPKCSVDSVFRGNVDLTISITNALKERATITVLVDLIFYDGEWLESISQTFRDVPAGRTATTDYLVYGAADTKSLLVDDFSCEIAEVEYR